MAAHPMTAGANTWQAVTNQVIPEAAVEAAARALDPQTMGSGGPLSEKFQDATRAEARAILEAAAPFMNRTIETAEELAALPEGTVVLNGNGNVCELFTVQFSGESPAKVYAVPGFAEDWPVDRITLPAIVLHEPTP